MPTWIWKEPLPGTNFFPHHRRWDCRNAMLTALRFRDDLETSSRAIGRAQAFNAIMFDCGDPMAGRYASRLAKIEKIVDAAIHPVAKVRKL